MNTVVVGESVLKELILLGLSLGDLIEDTFANGTPDAKEYLRKMLADALYEAETKFREEKSKLVLGFE